MAIEFDCPHCQHHYRLKDELAGKSATCKGCRQKIVIPQPVTAPDDAALSPEELAAREAAALAALSDEPAKAEQDAASKVVNVECNYCGHKWTEPITRAGKNTLCPNPECRQRVKIPDAKPDEVIDWRQTRTKGPSLAKENQQKLEGVVDAAADAKIVSGQALKEADATGEELEPRPLKQKLLFVLVPLGLVAGLVFGVVYWMKSRTENKEHRLVQEAQEEFKRAAEGLPKEEVPVFDAVLHVAAGEHAVRHNTREKLKEGMDEFARAREALRALSSPARNAACAELAVATLELGGTEEQAREQIRIRWTRDVNLKIRPNERLFTVFEELQKTLGLVAGADLEYRTHLARRLTRELVKRGQGVTALELIPRALFAPPEEPEARAVVALEIYRADKGSPLVRKTADEFKARAAELAKAAPVPASIETLFLVLGEKSPLIVSKPPAGAGAPDATRFAYVGWHALKGEGEEALALARRAGPPEVQVRALVLCADWLPDPVPALDAAGGILGAAVKSKKDGSVSPYAVLRLAQIAAAAGRPDQAKQFADFLADDGLKAWARGDAVRLRVGLAPKERADEVWAEVPDDAKKYRAGHAWGRFWVARQNTRVSGKRDDEVKAASAWPAALAPFGKAGVALGLQDRDK